MDNWKPQRKIVAGAIATVILFVVQAATGIDVPVGIEAAIVVIVGYWMPDAA